MQVTNMTKTTFASPRLKRLGDTYPPPALSICSDPIVPRRARVEGKYDHMFKAMKPGQAIKCDTADVDKIQQAMRTYIVALNVPGVVVKGMRDYGDGMGRVWMLAKPEKKLKVAA